MVNIVKMINPSVPGQIIFEIIDIPHGIREKLMIIKQQNKTNH